MKRWGAFVAVLVLGSACSGDNGSAGSGTDGSSSGEPESTGSVDPTTPESSSTTDGVGSSETTDTPTTTDSPGQCTGTCAPPVPKGWTGPVKVGDNAVDCNGGFADPAGAFFTDFDPGQDSCSCDCQPVDAACADTVEVHVWGEGGCAGVPDFTVDVGTDACSPIDGPFPPVLNDDGAASELSMDFVTIGPVLVDSGTCEGVATFNEGGFADSVQLCAATAEPSMCGDGGLCIADNTDVCVWQEGEQDCPDGYPEVIVGYGGSDDQRECGACDCGTPEGLCDSSITLQTAACGDVVSATNADCEMTGNADIAAATYEPGPATITCGGTGTAPISGTVEPTGAVTICCAR
ncbi:MAG: hypothetical protein KUG77_20940 [Nannocystaceae bacterium]|nr:hypothetical protein [Nannocystaceae bacterium]